MKKSAKAKSTNVSGWRKLAPKSSKRPATFAAFRKQAGIVGRIFLLFLVLGISGLAFWWMDRAFRSDYGPLDLTGPGAPINDVTFSSDGVLTLTWFATCFGPLRGRSYSEIDIHRLRMDLEKEPQIESAGLFENVRVLSVSNFVSSTHCLFFAFVVRQAVLRIGLTVLRVPYTKVVVIPVPSFPSCHRWPCLLVRSKKWPTVTALRISRKLPWFPHFLNWCRGIIHPFIATGKWYPMTWKTSIAPVLTFECSPARLGDPVCSPRLCRPVAALALYSLGAGISQEKSHRIHQSVP